MLLNMQSPIWLETSTSTAFERIWMQCTCEVNKLALQAANVDQKHKVGCRADLNASIVPDC
eukprot:880998-Amphidinium_carterae.1